LRAVKIACCIILNCIADEYDIRYINTNKLKCHERQNILGLDSVYYINQRWCAVLYGIYTQKDKQTFNIRHKTQLTVKMLPGNFKHAHIVCLAYTTCRARKHSTSANLHQGLLDNLPREIATGY